MACQSEPVKDSCVEACTPCFDKLPMTSLKNACHSECSEESSARYRAAKQGEEDPSFLRMTISINVISLSEARDLNTQHDTHFLTDHENKVITYYAGPLCYRAIAALRSQ